MIDTLGARRTDSATRVIAAPPETIYRAFLDPEAWVKWLPPEGMTGRIYQFEPRPGGSYRMALTYRKVDPATRGKTSDGTDMVVGRFLELVPDKQVVAAKLRAFSGQRPLLAAHLHDPSTACLKRASPSALMSAAITRVAESVLRAPSVWRPPQTRSPTAL